MVDRVLCAVLLAASAPAADPPAGLLPVADKPPDWVRATARCRELLSKLDPDSGLARKYLPNVRRCADMLRRTDAFHWKSLTAVEFLENMLLDLQAGRHPHRRYAGKELGFPYWSETMGRIEAIWVHVPPEYDPNGSYPLWICYKCGGGIHFKDGKAHGGYRPTAEAANRTGVFWAWSSLSIQVKGRMGAERELAEAPAALAKEFAVDPGRVFLTGWSDGGFTAVWLASRWPGLVAGIAPVCANWQYANVNEIGLLNVPILCVDGWGDGGYNTSQFRRWHALHTMGYDVAGLWGHHGHSYQPYEDPAELARILAWAKDRQRDPWPRRVRYATWGLTWHRAHWVSIERMVEPWLAGRIDAEVKADNRIEVRADNVAAYTLTLSEKLVDPTRNVTVVTNGKPSYAGPFRGEVRVEAVKPPAGRFVKSAAMPGDITAQVERSIYQTDPGGGLSIPGRRWLWVRPTGGDERTRKLLAGWAPPQAKDDTAMTDRDAAEANLFVFGGPDVNRFTARIAGDLPVTFAPGRFTIGRRVYDQPTNCLKLLHPNPLDPRRYVIVYAFNDAAAFAANGFFGTRQESSWKFRTGDCVVMGVRRPGRTWGVAVSGDGFGEDHYVFGADWRPFDGEPLARLAAPLSYPQLLRLRADAAREATGADAGIVFAYAPSWIRWRSGLPAGPVTAHDLATLDALPEYVATADVRGANLVELAARAAASTVLADRRDSSYVAGQSLAAADIDPNRTYRVAMGYHGLPGYGAEPKKMPPLHFFRTPEEFLAGGNTSLPFRNLRTRGVEMSAAVISYVRKRGRLAPRPACLDLAQYVMDPQANHYPAYDWLHLRVGAGPLPCTLNLALRETEQQDAGALRKAVRTFAEIDPNAAGPQAFDFGPIGGKLPMTAVATVRRVEGAGAGRAPARCTLVHLRLTNRSETGLTGLAILSPPAMRPVEGGTWPDKSLYKPLTTWYVGYRDTAGPRDKPTRQAAALLLFDRAGQKLDRLVVAQAGYNFGLVGIHYPLSIPAGGSITVPLLRIEATEPNADLPAAMEAIRKDITPSP